MLHIHRFTGQPNSFNWENTKAKEYPDGPSKSATGKIILGNDDGAPHFVFRYFCIQPGGYSAREDFHFHDHGVMILHGRAIVRVDDEEAEVGPNDMIYIPGWHKHHFTVIGDEPMGFLCVIPNKDMLKNLYPDEVIHPKGC
jgi:quercetin dioxygenase-like cupin family protein